MSTYSWLLVAIPPLSCRLGFSLQCADSTTCCPGFSGPKRLVLVGPSIKISATAAAASSRERYTAGCLATPAASSCGCRACAQPLSISLRCFASPVPPCERQEDAAHTHQMRHLTPLTPRACSGCVHTKASGSQSTRAP